mmetsp:Transcript_5050/g.16166  ORF Transcript_5050/g.16166 Transcript_5050/m.16166 type:complete len:221 (-) Transcript_5050:1674-2336(-)
MQMYLTVPIEIHTRAASSRHAIAYGVCSARRAVRRAAPCGSPTAPYAHRSQQHRRAAWRLGRCTRLTIAILRVHVICHVIVLTKLLVPTRGRRRRRAKPAPTIATTTAASASAAASSQAAVAPARVGRRGSAPWARAASRASAWGEAPRRREGRRAVPQPAVTHTHTRDANARADERACARTNAAHARVSMGESMRAKTTLGCVCGSEWRRARTEEEERR